MIIIIGIYLIILLGMLLTKKYEKAFTSSINRKEHPFYLFYPLALYMAHFIDNPKSERYKIRMERIKILHANEDVEIEYKIFRAKQFAIIVFSILIVNSFALCLQISSKEEPVIKDGQITRPSYGEEATDVDVDVIFNNESDYVKKHMTISVLPREYTKEEFNQAAEKAKEYLNKAILGENASLEKIYYPLKLISSIPDTDISVSWSFDKNSLIENDGTIKHRGLIENKLENLTAVMRSGEFEQRYVMSVILLPEKLSKEDALLYHLQTSVDVENKDTQNSDKISLPSEIDQHEVYYEESSENTLGTLFVFAVFILILLFFLMEEQLVKQKEERDIEIMLDYPEVINKFTLLIGAGMTVKKAWDKIVTEYEEKKKSGKTKRRYAYEELKVTLLELNNGVNESRAYENFGRRMQMLPYMKFGALLAQNVSKGMDGMLKSLELEAYTAFEERKELAKRLGEKAGTKLLLPMGIMLMLVFVMILIPAFMNF